MGGRADGAGASWQEAAGMSLAAAGLLIFYFSVFSLPVERTPFLNLAPDPDASEYLAGAVSLHKGDGYRIQLAGEFHPPRYPFGYSAVMAAALGLGVEPILAPFWVNRVAALALLLQIFLILRASRNRVSAGLGVLLLATTPAFIVLARSPLSEMTAAFWIVPAFFFFHLACRHQSEFRFWLCGLLAGISCCFRLSHFVFLPALWAGLLSRKWSSPFVRAREWVALTAGFAVGISPLLLYHLRVFGSPFSSGYNYWVPYWSQWNRAFHHSHLSDNLAYFWGELVHRPQAVTTADLYGLGSYFGPALALLAVPAAHHFLRKPELRPLAVAAAFFSLPFLFYFHQDGRLLFPSLVLAAAGIAVWASGRIQASGWVVRSVIFSLLVSHVAMFPGHRLDPDFERYLRRTRWHGPAYQHDLLGRLREFVNGRPVLVVTSMNPSAVYALTDGERIASPLPPDHDYRFNPAVFQFGPAALHTQIETALKKDWLVILALARTQENPLPGLAPGYEWKSFYSNAAGGLLAQAVPAKGREDGGR